MEANYDIAIVGGGLVGVSLAVALADAGRRTLLIERAPIPNGEESWDERCIALNDASRRILDSMHVWSEIEAIGAPIVATHISERGRFGVSRFTAAEVGLSALGYNVPMRAIGQGLWTHVRSAPIQLVCPASVNAVRPEADSVMLELRSESSGTSESVRVRLVAAADGAGSVVRKYLGIHTRIHDYRQHAIVSAVRTVRPHGGIAYERFTPEGPIAVLPKLPDACSLVWTVPSGRVETLLNLSGDAYRLLAQETFGGRLGRFTALGRRTAWPLAQVMSAQVTGQRTVFLGNAAQSLHPVAAQGFNLGLRDVATLAQIVRNADDPGSSAVLRDYVECRTRDRIAVSAFTDILVRTFSNRLPGLAQARHFGLLALDLVPAAHKRVLHQNLGYLGLPIIA